MNTLNLKLIGTARVNPTVLIDGKPAKLKKNEFGGFSCSYNTENSKAKVEIYKYLEISGKYWFLVQFFFFLISILGIFNPRLDKKCIVLDCSFDIDLNETNNVTFKFNQLKDEGEAVTIEGDCNVDTISNSYFVDKQAKKRMKILRIAEIFTWVAVIAVVAIIGIMKING